MTPTRVDLTTDPRLLKLLLKQDTRKYAQVVGTVIDQDIKATRRHRTSIQLDIHWGPHSS